MAELTRPLRVLHVLGPLRPSGMERMLVSSAPHFRAQNISGIVLGQGEENPFAAELRAAGFAVATMPRLGRSLSSAARLRLLVREHGVDVVHIHPEANYLRVVLAVRWALGRRGGIVRTVHSVFDAHGRWRFTRFVQAVIGDRFVDVIVSPSIDVAENERRNWRRSRIIPNWVDDRMFAVRDARDAREARDESSSGRRAVPLALIVGNCAGVKNHEFALRELSHSGHDLIHLGDESDASPEELALLAGLASEDRLRGRGVKDPSEALVAADYFLMPSLREGMSVALAEALVVGLPAIVSDLPGLRWARDIEGVTALSLKGSDWADAIGAVGSEQARREDARFDFSARRGAREYADLYREISAAGRRGDEADAHRRHRAR